MIDFTEHEKKVLSNVGRQPYGKELIQIIEKKRESISSLAGIDQSKDVTSQVEGRLLFVKFADAIIERLSFEARPSRPLNASGFE